MGKLIVSVLTSLDGYFEGPGHDLASMPFEDAFNTHNLELLRGASTMVYGGTWFEQNWNAWSAIAADPEQNDRDHEIASLVTGLDSLIISDSATIDSQAPWASTARVVPRAAAVEELRRLKQSTDGDLIVFGSTTTWNPLLEAGVVDELVVLIGGGLLGAGTKLYEGSAVKLLLLGVDRLDDSQIVRVRYTSA